MVRLNLLDGYSDSGATGAKIKVHSRTLGHGGGDRPRLSSPDAGMAGSAATGVIVRAGHEVLDDLAAFVACGVPEVGPRR